MPPKNKRHLRAQQARASQLYSSSADEVPTPLPQTAALCRVVLAQTDITTLSVDAIVNAANNELKRGGGVCGSIFRAAGSRLDVACAAINGCATGEAVLTESFDIRHIKAIVHAVGPRVIDFLTDQHRQQLANCYSRTLDAVARHGLTSIAFPCISTAIFGFPNVEAARVALDAVNQWLYRDDNDAKLSKVIFCTYLDTDKTIYQRLMPSVFPDFVDETTVPVVRGRPRMDSAETSERADPVSTDATPALVHKPHLTTQPSLPRKRGRPPKTPTKGPEQKQHRLAAVDDAIAVVAAPLSTSPSAQPVAGYRSDAEVPNKDEWLAQMVPLIYEDDVAKMLADPQNVMLSPTHVEMVLQHFVLCQKRPLLLVSVSNSTDFDTNHRRLGLGAAMSNPEWLQIATASVPPVSDDRVFGNVQTFDTVIIPVFVPGHFVLGIYEAAAETIHYYDSLPAPNAYTSKMAEVFLRETVKRVIAQHRPGMRIRRFERRAGSTYAKQTDGTSCGFFVCFYAEAYVTLRRACGFFMEDEFFIRNYRERMLTLLLSLHAHHFPDYAPLSGFAAERTRGITHTQSSFHTAQSTPTDDIIRAPTIAPSMSSAFPPEAARHATITKDAVQALLSSMNFAPADYASFPGRLSIRAIFLYMRTIASMRPLPVAVSSPLLALQKVYGKNAVPDVGVKIHKPPVNAHYVLIPYPIVPTGSRLEYDDALENVHWIVAIQSLEDNVNVVYDPAKALSVEQLATAEKDLKNMAISIRRTLRRTSTPSSFAIAPPASYTTFSSAEDSAFGMVALAECYISASTGGLSFKDFSMTKYKARMQYIFRQLHKKDTVIIKPLPGCRLVLASQIPPVAIPTTTTAPQPQDGPRRSARIVRRSEKDKAAVFTRTDLTLLCPMNSVNCGDHKARGLGCAAQTVNHKVRYYDTGEFDKRCPHCDTLLLASEVPRDGNQYTKCCAGGKVHTDAMQQKFETLQDMPEPLRRYAFNLPNDAEASNFNRNSKLYNNNTAFGSVSSKRDPEVIPGRGIPACRINGEMTHRLCDMYPHANHANELWAQHFIIDPAESLPKRVATLNRLQANPDYRSRVAINQAVVEKLDLMLREHHPFASAYRTAHDVYQKAKEDAERQGKQVPQFRLILLSDRHDEDALRDDQGGTIHIHRAPDPAAHVRQQNIAAIWVADSGDPPLFYGAYLYGKERGSFRELKVLDPNLDPALYPLLFTRGQQGYKLGLQLKAAQFTDQDAAEDDDDCIIARDMQGPDENNTRKFISGRQYDRYVSAHRGSDVTSPHWLHSKGKLAEFYAIDVANRREAVEFEEAKKKQQDKRLIAAKEFIQAMENQLQRDHPGSKLGKVMACKPTVKGSRPYMQRAFANAMTIFDRIGKPALFITFTGNPQWPEMQALLNSPGDTWLNHPQEAVRIFADKAYEFLTDVLDRQVFGVVTAYAISTELQMRGMPHLHCLFTLDDATPGLGTAAYVDEYISAELADLPQNWRETPEGRRQKNLYDSVVKFNVHDCNEWCLVGQPPRCNKRFPKPYSTETVVTPGHYVQYERRAPREAYDAPPSDDETDDGYHDAPPCSAAPKRRPPIPPGLVDPTDPQNYGNVCFKPRGRSEIMLDNSHVVPYSPFLTERYQTHINVEFCLGTACVSYALSYIMKGHTLAFVTTEEVDDNGNPVVNYDEYTQIQRCVFRTSAESALRTQGFPVVRLSHIVVELPVHAPGAESIAFVEGQEFAALDALAAGKKRSKLQAFFDMCREHHELTGQRLELLYCDVGISHWFDPKSNARCWNERQRLRDNLLCRVLSVSPKNAETFAVRLLLHHVKGPMSFLDLRTVTLQSGVRWTYDTFTEAAQHYGLLEDPNVWVRAIKEAAKEYGNPKRLRRYFASLVYNAAPPNPAQIFSEVLEVLWPPSGARGQTEEWRRRKTLNHLEYCFRQFNTSCLEMLGIAVDGYNEHAAVEDDELGGLTAHVGLNAGAGARNGWKPYWESNLAKMNDGQYAAFHAVLNALQDDAVEQRLKLFFLEGAGGTGKSFVYNTILGWCRDQGFRAVATASTGIAATVLIGGKTLHSTFWIPLEVTADTESRVKAHAEYTTPIKELQLIIVDEISMLNRDVLTYVDTMLKDVSANKDEPFAGKVVVIGGDWKQLCPVVKGVERQLSRAAAVNASVKSLPLFRKFYRLPLTENMRVKEGQRAWAEYITKVGNGKTLVPGTSEMPVDADLLVKTEEDLIAFIFPQDLLGAPLAYTEALLEAAILAPKLDTVARLNNLVREMLPGSDIVCESINTPLSENPLQMLNVNYAAQQVEHLNRRNESGMPRHILTFRVGMILVLMRNIDQQMGLCNGTRLQLLKKIGENLKCRVLSGPMSASGGFVLIPRIRFEYGRKSDEKNIDRFVRVQYPVIPAFAMTINKAQGQTLQRVGLHLGAQVFSHGQVYTAFSRVTSREGIRIFNDRPTRPNYIVNIVYDELLDARTARTPSPTVPDSQRIDRDLWPAVPGLGTTPPASWTRQPQKLESDSDSGDDDEFFSFPDGRAPDIGQDQHQAGADDLDWVDKFFYLIAPESSQAPDRNVFNLMFYPDEPVDPNAWDDDLSEKCKITLTGHDITKLHVDAIVNAANDQLKFGGGVCGAIFRAAGRDKLQAACDQHNGCRTGDAVITDAYGIKTVQKIIHAVGPMVKHGVVTDDVRHALYSCYTRSLDLAKEHGLRSIAFPCISIGIYGYPADQAAITALGAVECWMSRKPNAQSIDKIVFSVVNQHSLDIYREELPNYCAAYYDEINDEVVHGQMFPADNDGDDEKQSAAPSRMTVIVDSLSYRKPSSQRLASKRPESEIPPPTSSPYLQDGRRSQPPKWPQRALDRPLEELKRRLQDDYVDDIFVVDEEEREAAQRFLQEQEALQLRQRERQAAEASSHHHDATPSTTEDSFYTPMEVDQPAATPQQVELRAKKTDAQKALQAAFRTSFNQAKLMEAVRGRAQRFVQPAQLDYFVGAPEQPPPVPQHARGSDSGSSGDDEDAMPGRMSRMSLHQDDLDDQGFVTPTARSTPAKTQDVFSTPQRPSSLYSPSTPTKTQDAFSPTKRPLSLYVPSRTPLRAQPSMSPRSPSASPRTQDAFTGPSPSGTPTTPKKSPLKSAIKSVQKAVTSIAKTALPGQRSSKALKEFQKAAAEEQTTPAQSDIPPPVPRHGMPKIPEESDSD